MVRLCCTLFMTSFLCLYSILLHANQETFLRANALYIQQKYQEALQLYDTLDNKGPAVWYNMGRCAEALHSYGQARLFYERAKRNASTQLYQAIKKDRMHTADMVPCAEYSTKPDRLVSHLHTHGFMFPLLFLQILFLILWASILYCVRSTRIRWRISILTFLIILLAGTGFFLLIRFYEQRRELAIVMVSSAHVYAGPHEQYHELGAVRMTECVHIIRKDGAWYNIKYDGGTGWVKQETITAV